MKRILSLILVLMILFGSAARAQDALQYSLETIAKVPDFSTVDQLDSPIDQSVFTKSDRTLLVFWATWCNPCVAEIPALVAAESALQKMGVQIVGICEDGKTARDSALKILQTQGASYANIMPNDQFYDELVERMAVESASTMTFILINGIEINIEQICAYVTK